MALAALGVAASLMVAGCAKDAPQSGETASTSPTTPIASASPTPTASASSISQSSATPTPSATTPTSTPSGTPSSVGNPRKATMVFSGDLLWHNTLWISAGVDHQRTGKGGKYDFDPMFAAMKPTIESADLAVCHNEVPFAREGQTPAGYPAFRAPREIGAWLPTMGWDACTAASNHSIDQGFPGLVDTWNVLKSHGIQPVGTFPSEQARNTPVIVTTKTGVKVGLVSGTYATNGIPIPKGKEWSLSMWDTDNLLAQAKRARAAGADIVVVSMHGGDEYQTKPNAAQVKLATALTASSDVDLVVGQHVHVVQPITKINGKWVVYGMGNMVAQHMADQPRGYEGITVRFGFTETTPGKFAVDKAEYIPTMVTCFQQGSPVRLYAVNDALKGGQGDRARLTVAQERTRKAVRLLGSDEGLVER